MSKIIGIPCWTEGRDSNSFHEVNNSFAELIIKAGGVPLILPQVDNEVVLDGYMDILDGLLLVGGSDISPFYYGEGPDRYLESTTPKRDKVEFYILEKAIAKKIPILGVCRGMQLINIHFGGDLYQDIYSQIDYALNHSDRDRKGIMYFHEINIEKDSDLHDVFGSKLMVNTFHHQAIKKLAEGFKTTALSPDGLIEAMEYEEGQFIMAIQFHPEFPEHNKDFKNIFKFFVEKLNN